MLYLTAQIWFHLALAFVLGGGVAWWHLRRAAEDRQSEWEELSANQRKEIERLRSQLRRRMPPARRSPRSEPRLPEQLVLEGGAEGEVQAHEVHDDLTRIKGIGGVLAGRLNQMGVHTFREIASWTGSDIERIQAAIPEFPGRIRRDDWVSQAAELDQTSPV
ncbi:MAG: hypothetical protein ACR2QM_08575 [Longimicrobiales bacterium]